jgi:uncharacterized lipoprotein
MREAATALVVLLTLAGCATTAPGPPPPTSREVAASPGTVKARLVERLVGLGFKVTGTDRVQAESPSASADWAECGRILVESSGTDTSSRMSFEDPQARSATVAAVVTAQGDGSVVALEPGFSATYLNQYKNVTFREPCESTGRLERELLDAASAG